MLAKNVWVDPMITKSKFVKTVPSHLVDGVQDFLDSIQETGSVRKTFKYGMIIIATLGDEDLASAIFHKVADRYGPPPFITRNYIFSKSEIEQSKVLEIGSDTAPLDEVETLFRSTNHTCPQCLSGSRVVSAHIKGPKLPRQHFMQTIDYDMIISADIAQLLIKAGCPSSDLIPARWQGEDDQFYLINPEKSAPPLSPQSEGVFIDKDHPCTACNRRYSGLLSVPQLLRYNHDFWGNLPANECGFYWSWEYFGAWIDPSKLDPRYASIGRPKLLATKKCCDILRDHCKQHVETIPVFPEV